MTELTRRPAAVVYDRLAGVYDWYTAPLEALGGRRARRRVLARATDVSSNWASAPGSTWPPTHRVSS